MANKTLNAKVKFETKSAEASLNRLAKKINNVQNAVNKTSKNNTKLTAQINKATTAQNRLNAAANKTANTTQKIATANRKAVNSANALSGSYRSANRSASGLLTTIKRLSATYLGVMGMKAIIGTSDTITSTQNKLNALNGGNENLTQEQMDKMYVSSNKVRMDYSDMLDNASKSMTLAGDAFQGNMDNAIRFQEIMAETYALGGASAPEMSTSMYQMIQALGAGTLAGDELRSVREGAPLAYKAIEEFAQGIYNTTDSLKDMAAEGKITSDMVVAAVMDAGERIDSQFRETEMTFGQAWNRIKSAAIKAFEPVSYKLNEMLNKAAENGAFEKIETIFFSVSKVLQIAFQVIYNVIEAIANAVNWVIENWDLLSRIILTVLTIIGVTMAVILFPQFIAWLQYLILAIGYYSLVAIQAVSSALATAAAWAIANWQMLLIIAVIAAIIIAIIWLADSFEDACGMIVGGIMAAVAFVWNLIVGVINAIIQYLWTHFVEPWIGIIEWVLNVFNGGFNNFGDAVKNLLGNIISWFLSLGKVVTKIIDAIFGTNWTDGLNSLQDKVLQWGKNEEAITLSREAPEVLQRWDYGDAYDTGYDWGYSAGSWISDKFSGLGDSFSLDSIGEKLGLDFGNGFPNADDYDVSKSYNYPSSDDLLGGIKNDTGSIADNMELSKEDLDYLRKIAEMEWKKEFTTANITVDMTNNNNVSNDYDLHSLAIGLRDLVEEEMFAVANGVYA